MADQLRPVDLLRGQEAVNQFSTDDDCWRAAEDAFQQLASTDIHPECGIEGLDAYLREYRDDLRCPELGDLIWDGSRVYAHELRELYLQVWDLGGSHYPLAAVTAVVSELWAEENGGADMSTEQRAAWVAAELKRTAHPSAG